jgi:hypothetical protein
MMGTERDSQWDSAHTIDPGANGSNRELAIKQH